MDTTLYQGNLSCGPDSDIVNEKLTTLGINEVNNSPIALKQLKERDLRLPSVSDDDDILYKNYEDESMLPQIQTLVARDLSEPYSIFTYRYFLHNWPELCLCVFARNNIDKDRYEMVGVIVCKAEVEMDICKGYIAMLAVCSSQRKKGIGSKLVKLGIERMIAMGCEEIILETEVN